MDADVFDEGEFFAALARSGARILLIGRRALIALGLPMVTADYDLRDLLRLGVRERRPRAPVELLG